MFSHWFMAIKYLPGSVAQLPAFERSEVQTEGGDKRHNPAEYKLWSGLKQPLPHKVVGCK
jgi:hypothetical protein